MVVLRVIRENNMAKKLFVGGLAWATSNESLKAAFEAYGEVTSAEVVTDRYSGRSKGFGFVEMANDDDAAKAVDGLNGKEIDGRGVTVSEARPKSDAPSSDAPAADAA